MAFYNPLYAAFSIAIVASVIGAFFGEFCAKLVYRLGGGRFRGLAIFSPSFCPNCAKRIKFSDKLPIIGYIRTKGHCRRCHALISPRYLIFEVVGFCLPAILFYFENYSLKAIYDYFFIMIMLTGAYISYDTEIFPSVLSVCIILLAAIYNFFLVHDHLNALLGAVIGIVLNYVLMFTSTSKKSIHQYALLSFGLGLYFGWEETLIFYILYLILLGVEHLYDNFEGRERISSGTLFSSAAIFITLFGLYVLEYVQMGLRFITS